MALWQWANDWLFNQSNTCGFIVKKFTENNGTNMDNVPTIQRNCSLVRFFCSCKSSNQIADWHRNLIQIIDWNANDCFVLFQCSYSYETFDKQILQWIHNNHYKYNKNTQPKYNKKKIQPNIHTERTKVNKLRFFAELGWIYKMRWNSMDHTNTSNIRIRP